jgi:hypothetical protein
MSRAGARPPIAVVPQPTAAVPPPTGVARIGIGPLGATSFTGATPSARLSGAGAGSIASG